jgi:hypothetical protein
MPVRSCSRSSRRRGVWCAVGGASESDHPADLPPGGSRQVVDERYVDSDALPQQLGESPNRAAADRVSVAIGPGDDADRQMRSAALNHLVAEDVPWEAEVATLDLHYLGDGGRMQPLA